MVCAERWSAGRATRRCTFSLSLSLSEFARLQQRRRRRKRTDLRCYTGCLSCGEATRTCRGDEAVCFPVSFVTFLTVYSYIHDLHSVLFYVLCDKDRRDGSHSGHIFTFRRSAGNERRLQQYEYNFSSINNVHCNVEVYILCRTIAIQLPKGIVGHELETAVQTAKIWVWGSDGSSIAVPCGCIILILGVIQRGPLVMQEEVSVQIQRPHGQSDRHVGSLFAEGHESKNVRSTMNIRTLVYPVENAE